MVKGAVPQEGPPRKRLRVSRACDQCRKRRDGCDGQQPSCQGCIQGNRVCTYDQSTKKRGLPTGYVRGLEMTLGFVLHNLDGSENLISSLFDNDVQGHSTHPPREAASAKTILTTWRQSGAMKQLDSFLSAPNTTEDDEAFMKRFDDKLAQLSTLVTSIDQHDVAFEDSYEQTDAHTTLVNAYEAEPAQTQALEGPRLPPNWSELIDSYLSTTHCWFPISQKYDLLRTAHALADAQSRNEIHTDVASQDPSPGDRAFVWAVLAYASLQTDAHMSQDDPQTACSPAKLYEWAVKAIETRQSDESGHIRALLVIALINIGRSCWTAAWRYTGEAIYAGIDIGMIPSDRNTISRAATDESARRTALGCFLVDTLVSSRLKRRPYLRHSDLQVIGLIEVNGNEEWETTPSGKASNSRHQPGRILSTFNALLQLCGLLNDCTSSRLLEDAVASTIPQDLHAWKAQLPAHCRLSDEMRNLQQMNLSLVYFILKAIISNPADLYNHIYKVVSFLHGIRHEFGPGSLTPLSQVYLGLCSALISPLQQSTAISNEVLGLVGNIDEQRRQVDAIWKADIQDPMTLLQQTDLPLTHGLIPLTPFSDPRLIVDRPQNLVSDPHMDHTNILGSHLDKFPDPGTMIPHALDSAPDTTYDPFLLPGDQDSDALFSNLAMLDPIEWPVYQTEFMSHLGYMSGANT